MPVEIDIRDLSLVLLLINVIFSFKIIRTKTDLKWFEALLIWSLFIQIAAKIVGQTMGNNMPLLHIYTLFEFVFMSLFYKEIIFNSLKIKKYFTWFLIFIIVLIICNSLLFESILTHNIRAKGLTQIIIISYSIFYFFNRISVEIQRENIYLNRINAAILMYYAGSLFIFIFAEFLLEHSELVRKYFWDFNALLYLVFQLLILIATWKIVFLESSEIKSKD